MGRDEEPEHQRGRDSPRRDRHRDHRKSLIDSTRRDHDQKSRRERSPRERERRRRSPPMAYRHHNVSPSRRRSTDSGRHRRSPRRSRSKSRSHSPSEKRLSDVKGNKNFERAKALGLLEQDKVAAAAAAAALNAQQLAAKLGQYASPQELVQRQMGQLASASGINVPAYYNPAAVNPLRMAEQIQKRKLLWAKPASVAEAPEPSSSTSSQTSTPSTVAALGATNSAAFFAKAAFDDDKSTEKFRKLMGIKDPNATAACASIDTKDIQSKQEELFRDLDQQYHAARLSTHTMRGVGLGFSSSHYQPK